MSLKPDDLVLVCVKAPSGNDKNVDWWEETQHHMLSQLIDQPVFQVKPEGAVGDENIRVLNRNMLFPVQSAMDSDSVIVNDDKHFALMKENLLMDLYFNN